MSGKRAVIVHRGEGIGFAGPFGDTIAWVAGEEATAGGFSLHERIAPPGSSSVPHVHHEVIEAFYVIDGALDLRVGGEEIDATAGTLVLVPMAVEHSWRNATRDDARVLVFFSPSAKRSFFEEQDALVRAGTLDAATWRALNEKYGWT